MTTPDTRVAQDEKHPAATQLTPVRSTRAARLFLAVATVVAVLAAFLVSDRTVEPGAGGMAGMSMTHYMGLLSIRQPWNLLLFMALPVVLAETLAITELVLLLGRATPAWVRRLSHGVGLLVGPVWVFIALHLVVHAVLPLTRTGGWAGPADVIAVGAYLLGGVPMIVISLLEAGVLVRDDPSRWLRLHVAMVAVFLVVAHIAMIVGMLDPTVLQSTTTPDMGDMGGDHMHHGMGATPTPSAP